MARLTRNEQLALILLLAVVMAMALNRFWTVKLNEKTNRDSPPPAPALVEIPQP